jgi:hypothetical protein
MSEPVKKLIFDKMDFKFMAAYGQYSEKYDNAEEDTRREELNEAISLLYSNEITYPEFYSSLDKELNARNQFYRSKISTSRKFAYRENERKVDRIKRHK